MKILFIPLLLITLAIIWIIYPVQRAIKKSQALVVGSVAYEQHPSSPSQRILVMGDSTAIGIGATSPTLSIAGRIGAKYPTSDISNISRNGMRLAELATRITELPTDTMYDLIVLQIGANDVTHLTSLHEVRRTLRSIIELAAAKGSEVIVMSSGNVGLSPVFRFPLSTILSKRTRDVREIYMDEIDKYENVSYIDLYHERDTDVFSSDIEKYYAMDHFHPSEHGYMVWFTEVERALSK